MRALLNLERHQNHKSGNGGSFLLVTQALNEIFSGYFKLQNKQKPVPFYRIYNWIANLIATGSSGVLLCKLAQKLNAKAHTLGSC